MLRTVLPQSSEFNVFFSVHFVQVQHEKQHNDLLSLSLSADIPLLAETMFFPFFLTGENTKNIPFRTNQVKHDKFPLKSGGGEEDLYSLKINE